MGVKKMIKGFFCKIDFFSQPVTMRFREQPNYQTMSGGIVSLGIIVVFLSIFSVTTFNTFEKQYITFTQIKSEETTPSLFSVNVTNDFMFAVGITNLDMNSGNRYFDIVMQFRIYDNYGKNRTQQNVVLVQCQKAHFQVFGSQFGEAYTNLELNKWLCPSSNMTLELQGKYTSQTFKFYKITVYRCGSQYNVSGRVCANSSDIQKYLSLNQAYIFDFYFINKLLNPGDHDYITNILDDFNYFPFSTTSGISADIFVNSYEFRTDESIWPIEEINTVRGGLVQEPAQRYAFAVQTDIYAKLYIRKSSTSFLYQRQFRKADDTISYIGGLFTSIIALMFIFGTYQQACYELQVARVIIRDGDNEKIDTQNFHLLNYLTYMFYKVCLFVGCKPNMPKSQKYHQAIQQIQAQMDIRLIMKRLQHYENISKVQLSQHQNLVLLLKSQRSLQSAENLRKEYKYRKDIFKEITQYKKKQKSNEQGKNLTTEQIGVELSDLLFEAINNNNSTNSRKVTPIQYLSENKNNQTQLQQLPQNNNMVEIPKERILKLAKYVNRLQKEAKTDEVSKKILSELESDILQVVQDIKHTQSEEEIKQLQKIQSD